jgi:hypothetical protein
VYAAPPTDFALQSCAIERVLQIAGAELVKHFYDGVAPEICGVAHGQTPIALGNQGGFVN